MDVWNYWLERKVYIILKNQRKYEGVVIGIDDSRPPLIWIIILDKNNERVQFESNEIELIEEEK